MFCFVFGQSLPGQYYDVETGLNFNNNRNYAPATGRYVQSDPIGLVADLSTYSYVGGDPLDYVDPYGLQRTSVDIAIEQAILRGDVAELETLLEAANPEQAQVIQRALTPARDLISGGLKRSPSYASELEEDSYAEICKMSKQGGDIGKKAKQMKKLIEQAARLKGKGY
jgi:RHS repeat-associated protein